MAYTYSKTDWTLSDYMSHTEMNRITENINAVFGASLKNNYTQNDILTASEWEAICSIFPEVVVDETITYRDINKIEAATEAALNGLHPSTGLYPSDELYPRG